MEKDGQWKKGKKLVLYIFYWRNVVRWIVMGFRIAQIIVGISLLLHSC